VGYTDRYKNWCEGVMKYAFAMGSCAMIYIPSFIQIGSGILKLIGGETDTLTESMVIA
jgi:hypothetical protein